MIDGVIDRLTALRNPDGGWGTTAGRPSSTEATALTLMALAPHDRSLSDGAADWLLARQREDGAWPVMEAVPEASWSTSLAVLALVGHPTASPAVRRGLEWITASKGAGVGWRFRLAELLRKTKIVELDPTLQGWSWTPGTFSWIEPTVWGILALQAGYADAMPRAVRKRIDEGRELIVDRACPGGGWNYGNKIVLGVDLEPYPDSTALALLALAGTDDGRQEVHSGFTVLQDLLRSNRSGLTLSLSILCHRAWNRGDAALHELLERSFATTGFLDEVRTLAFAAIATTTGPTPILAGDD